ncbi:MAG: DUF6622 family protein, partial [Pseudomonadota bacterium]
ELPTGRPAKITLWYPQGQCAALPDGQLCLAESATTDRTLVFIHGAMGAAENYTWITTALASAGYVVIGINHYGESWVYGEDSQNVRTTAMLWQRPADISAIYDALSNRQLFQKNINWTNIIALGHSSGGQTAGMLAGVRYDLLAMVAFCKTAAAADDHSCDYGIRNAPAPGQSFVQKFSEDHRDSRVKKVVMIDPTLGYGATAESLATARLPALVVGAANNDFLPWQNHGERYARDIPGAITHLLTGQEGHFVFVDNCNSEMLVMGVPLCKDRAGVDRAATHATLTPVILDFVRANNIVIERTQPLFNVEQLMPILLYTPRWVFGLLAALVVVGLMQTRTRRVPVKVAYVLPAAMMTMSLLGTFMNLGFTAVTVLFWLLGTGCATAIIVRVADSTISYDAETRKFNVEGSWTPLRVIMAIFLTRYAMGVSIGMNLSFVHDFYFAPTMSFLSGAFSGYFI